MVSGPTASPTSIDTRRGDELREERGARLADDEAAEHAGEAASRRRAERLEAREQRAERVAQRDLVLMFQAKKMRPDATPMTLATTMSTTRQRQTARGRVGVETVVSVVTVRALSVDETGHGMSRCLPALA